MKRIGTSGLGYGQTFVIILGFLITSALIFMFGIWVGRDIVERRLGREDRAVRGVVPPRPTETREEADVAFYEQLKQKAEERLQQTQTAKTAPPVESTPVATRAVAMATAVPSPRASVAAASAATPTSAATVVKPTPRPTTARTVTPVHRSTDNEWADAGWTVQVNATTDQDEARGLAARLRGRGYDAYVVQAPLRGQTWYRVRVGRLPGREQAKELEEKLRNSEGMDAAYITPQ